jgi:DnaK suppressor protein
MISREFIQQMQSNLIAQRKEILDKYFSSENTNIDEVDADGDETDEVQANMLIGLTNQLHSRNSNKLMQINGALSRINDSTYGICEDCGEFIVEKRLLVNPYSMTCISCAEEREMYLKHRKRL